ncbi:Epidermal growth factor receptor substrate 15 [Gigaspora margarita]|uniref:Epidermal growth factor receptor substrate 15 n=1 Tax=Gigaspora margarita TaxID=4874 RepID=A0A8H3X092_GIGMA|nr:Epidermal growth factor receptor substrate 15 [Gigaspora margarita]
MLSKGPQIILTPEEKRVYGYFFQLADVNKKGVIEGQHAVKFFSNSGLPPSVLREIWHIADSENLGYLSQQSFSVAVKLIAQAQNGQSPDPTNINAAAPLPRFDGVYIISTDDRDKYIRMFIGLNPVNGDLDGEGVRDILMKSKLPLDKLGQIWTLADTKKRGKLDMAEFIIAMYFVQNTMNGTIKSIPSVLPEGLYDMASGKTPSTSSPSSLPTSPQPASRQIAGVVDSPMSPIIQNYSWDVTAEDKATYDRYFTSVDGINKGYLTGDEAANFFMKSRLTPNVLAQIWDLADIRKSGTLNRDEFAVAMYLITKKMSGVNLPTTLPPSLIPPSMRSIPTAFPDSLTRSGTIKSPPIGKRASLLVFEQGLNPSSPSPFFNSSSVSQSSSDFDLLGDTDINTQVAIENGEIRALKSQADNLSGAISEFKTSRANLDTDLANLAVQKNEITTRLSQVRTLYDSEHRSLQEVQANYKIEYESLERAREELAQAERALEQLQSERDKFHTSIQKDRDEMQDIKRRMRLAEERNVTIKAEIEKLKTESRKQKGLLDINRMQLTSAEKEKDKALKTLQDLEGRDIPDDDPFGTGAFVPNPSDSVPLQGNINSQPGLEFADNSSQSRPNIHNRHSSISSLGGGVKRTMSNSSLASNSTVGTSSVKSSPFNSSKLEESMFDKPNSVSNSKSIDVNNIFGENTLSTNPQDNDTAVNSSRSINSFDMSFNTPFAGFNKDITKSDNVPQQIVEKSEEKSDTDPFATFSNFKRSSTGKSDYNSPFSTTFVSNNDIVASESFTTEFPSLEEIEASVESGAKIGFDNNFSSIPTNTENKDNNIFNSEVLNNETEITLDNPALNESPKNSAIVEEAKDKINAYNKGVESPFVPAVGEMSEPLGGGLAPMKDSESWISVEKLSESKPSTQIDDFDAVFADLTDAKVTKTPPINFDADFDDTDFKEDFNPTFDAPVTLSKPAFNISSSGNNMGVTPSISSRKNSSTDFDKFDKAFNNFDPFSSSTSSTTSNATKPNLVDAAFGGITSEPPKATNSSIGFDDAFEELLKSSSTPPSKTEPPLDLKSTIANDSKASISSGSSQLKIQSMDDDDDDVEQVKQLKAMGFSREKSIDALGRYDYDIEKAANFLFENP